GQTCRARPTYHSWLSFPFVDRHLGSPENAGHNAARAGPYFSEKSKSGPARHASNWVPGELIQIRRAQPTHSLPDMSRRASGTRIKPATLSTATLMPHRIVATRGHAM